MTRSRLAWRLRGHPVVAFCKSAVVRANYHLGNYKHVVWLIGDGRSGTTWVADVINWDKRYREMFEPFHPLLVSDMHSMALHQYIRVNDTSTPLIRVAADVFAGRFTHHRVDQQNTRLLYRGLLIKDIFANLLACWASRHFPGVKIVLLIRNPFAVAVSKWKRRYWSWMTDPRLFLQQPALLEDYLGPFQDAISQVSDDYVERQVMIWAIIHYVPLRQFKSGEIYTLFYENVYENPREEFSRLLRYLNPRLPPHGVLSEGMVEAVARPSYVAGSESTVLLGQSPIGQWRKELTPNQVTAGKRILDMFGLGQLYGDDGRPKHSGVHAILSRGA